MHQKINIVHLDDHSLMRKGIKDYLSMHFITEANIEGFGDGHIALDYIKNCFESNIKVDIVITDYAHMGLNGIEFAKELREVEKKYNIRTPIMLFSMHGGNKELFITQQQPGLFDAVLFKNASNDELNNFFNQFLEPKKSI